MLIDFSELEPEGREVIAAGLTEIDIMPDLATALSDSDVDATDLTFDRSTDGDLKIAAGIFAGILRVIDIEQFPKTASFCKVMFLLLTDELQWRSSPARQAALN